jgi:hypothetical protein
MLRASCKALSNLSSTMAFKNGFTSLMRLMYAVQTCSLLT